jgi:SP family sugar:H+ symporter-like MFS transporter
MTPDSTEMFKIAGQSALVRRLPAHAAHVLHFSLAADATTSSLAVGITNFGASCIAIWLVNSFGRRRLLFIGITWQIIGYAIAATALLAPAHVSVGDGWVMVSGLLLFVINFSYSSGPLAWVIISEVFPLGARGKGAGIATACNWLSNYIVALCFPIAVGDQEGRDQQKVRA